MSFVGKEVTAARNTAAAVLLICAAALSCSQAVLGADPIRNREQRAAVWTDFLDNSRISSSSPQWNSSVPFGVNDLYIGMDAKDIEKYLGRPGRCVEEDAYLYGGNAVVRVDKGRVVNISVARPDSRDSTVWSLTQGGSRFIKLGDPASLCLEKMGQPFAYYQEKKKGIRIAVYSHSRSDIGIFFYRGQVEGFLFTAPGMLVESLRWSGYTLETDEASEP